MKVLIIAPSLDSSLNVSGISSVVRLIISNNDKHEYVHFKVGKADNDSRGFKWLLNTLGMYPKWFKKMFSKDFDLIHFNIGLGTLSVIRDLPLIWMARLAGRKMVLHIHGGIYMYNKANCFVTFLIRRLFNKKNPVIALSEPEKEILQTRYKAQNVTVLPNCIDLTDAMKCSIDDKDKSENSILFMSRLTKEKGLGELLDAVTILKSENIPFKLYMAGAGADESFFIPKFRDILGDAFAHLGVVSGVSKTNILKKCRIYVLPSHFEGLPMALLEAMAFGEAPVVTNVGSIHTVLEDGKNGLMVPPKESAPLAEKLKLICTSPNMPNEFGAAARKTIFDKFRPEVYINSLNKLYDSCF